MQTESLYCDACGRYFERETVKAIELRGHTMFACPLCEGALRVERARVLTPFVPKLLGAFGFAFRADGAAAIAATAIFAALVSYVPLVSFVGFAARVGLGIFVLRATARGEDRLPLDGSTMDSTDWFDWLRPVLVYVGVAVACFGPALLVSLFVRDAKAFVIVAASIGLVYFPAAVTGAALSDPPSPLPAFDLVRAGTLMARVPGPYLVTVLASSAALVLATGASLGAEALGQAVPVPFLPTLVSSLVSAASFATLGRLLGLFAEHHREEID